MAVQSLEQLEKNVSASFSYVKKDLLMLNDALSDINDRIQHLSLNHAALLEKIRLVEERVNSPKKEEPKKEKKVSKKVVNKKEVLEFYDLRTKKKFKSGNYIFKVKSGRRFAVADAPSGVKSWRIVGMDKSAKPKVKKITAKKTVAPKRVIKETIEY